MVEWHFVASGLLVGVVVGLTGVGGGSLMTPLLVMLFGISPATAVGTDLLYAGITKAAGSTFQSWQQRVHWRIAGLLALGSIPSSVLTARVLSRFALNSASGTRFLTVALALALLFTAAALMLRGRVRLPPRLTAASLGPRTLALTTVAVGALLGVFVTLTSVGSGALGTVALCVLYPRLPTAAVIGTEIAHAVPLTLVAGLGHLAFGSVDFGLLGNLLAGSIPGVLIGSLLGGRAAEHHLRYALSLVLTLVSIKLLW